MKFCSKCGQQLFDEAVICPACGCPTENQSNFTASRASTNEIIAIRAFSEKATVIRNLGIVAAILMFGIGIIFSIVILILAPEPRRFAETTITTANPLELAEFESAKRKLQLGLNLALLPFLGLAICFFIVLLIMSF